MNKVPVDSSDGKKNHFSTMTREAHVERGKWAVAIENDNDKYRLPAYYVSSILNWKIRPPCPIH
jgi:hypothetical protein